MTVFLPDILHKIFLKFSHPFELVTARKVCRIWCRVADASTTWLTIARQMRPFFEPDECEVRQRTLDTIDAARLFCHEWFSQCCGVCLKADEYDVYDRWRHSERVTPFNEHYNNSRKDDPPPCCHEYMGFAVHSCCIDCHRDVFHARIVESVEQMMSRFGFKEQKWSYFAEKGWAERIQQKSYGWGWDEETIKEGYGEDDACSEIVDICQASKWCCQEALKLGLFHEYE